MERTFRSLTEGKSKDLESRDRMMKVKKTYITAIIVLLALVSCQKEESYTGPCDVRFKAYVQDEVSVTRATTYSDISSTNTPAFTAGLFVWSGLTVSESTLTWNGTNATSNLGLEQGNYTIYGYAPRHDEATFDPTTQKMTVPGISGLSYEDAIVILPKELEIELDDRSKDVTLQLHHMMAKITPRFYLNSTYAGLRTIKIKKVQFWIEGGADTHTATVTYTGDADNPYNIEWTEGEPIVQQLEVYSVSGSEAIELTTTKGAQEYGCCYLCPNQSTALLKMRVTYDVYDKTGQLTRPDAEAVNTIKKLNTQDIVPGTDYKLNIQIVPTYLYVLSDNDEESLVIND